MAVRKGVGALIAIGIGISLLLAGVVSFYASSSPDGLEKVAGDIGFGQHAQDSPVAGSPLSGYGVTGVGDERLSVGIAGIVGVVLTAVAAFGLFLWLARRNRPAADPTGAPAEPSGAPAEPVG